MRHSVVYTFIFAAIICIVCGVLVSTAAVSLKDRQDFNAALDKKKNILLASGLLKSGESSDPETVDRLFANIQSVAINLETGKEAPDFDLEGYDQSKASQNPDLSSRAPANRSAINRVPTYAQIYKIQDASGALDQIVFPIEGLGLWGTLYGFLAVDADLETVRGITYYLHKETPGLGGEVDNPRWKAKWPGRKIYGPDGNVAIQVIKGEAAPPAQEPFKIDGLSGATLTNRGVTSMLDFWMGERGFGPYIDSLRAGA